MRFYVYMFLVTVANILLTLLLPVRDLPNSRSHRIHLTTDIVQIDFVGIGSRFGLMLFLVGWPLNPHAYFS